MGAFTIPPRCRRPVQRSKFRTRRLTHCRTRRAFPDCHDCLGQPLLEPVTNSDKHVLDLSVPQVAEHLRPEPYALRTVTGPNPTTSRPRAVAVLSRQTRSLCPKAFLTPTFSTPLTPRSPQSAVRLVLPLSRQWRPSTPATNLRLHTSTHSCATRHQRRKPRLASSSAVLAVGSRRPRKTAKARLNRPNRRHGLRQSGWMSRRCPRVFGRERGIPFLFYKTGCATSLLAWGGRSPRGRSWRASGSTLMR